MVWFKVDDSFHSHPKATACSLAALGLWAAAGSWSGDHLTDGFVPDHQIPLLTRGSNQLVDELVAVGLWKRAKGGYRFHQWHCDGDGTKRNPTKKEVEEERRKKAEAGRKGGLASGKTRSKRSSRNEARATAGASRLVEPPTRPDPTGSSGSVGDPPQVRNAHAPEDDDDLDQKIIDLLHDLTGRTVDRDWAARVRGQLLNSRDVTNPAAYVAAAIRGAPRDYLPAVDRQPPRLADLCDHGRDARTCPHCHTEGPG